MTERTKDFTTQVSMAEFTERGRNNSHYRKSQKRYRVIPYPERTMLVKMLGKPMIINVILVYASTVDKSDEDVEQFYGKIKELLKLAKQHKINIFQGLSIWNGRYE